MSIEIKVPQLPESIQDATIVNWHKRAGDAVKRDENLVDIETDKVVLECPAPADGVLKEIRIQDGTTVTAGQVIALLEPGAAPAVQPGPLSPCRRHRKRLPPQRQRSPLRRATQDRSAPGRSALRCVVWSRKTTWILLRFRRAGAMAVSPRAMCWSTSAPRMSRGRERFCQICRQTSPGWQPAAAKTGGYR